MSKKPDYEVFVSRENDGKTYYTRIGAAWSVDKNGISVKLEALPVGSKMVLFPPKSDEKSEQ